MEFSELALQKLLQIMPELSQYIVTFKDMSEDLNQDESTDLQVGAFILALGGGYLYVPVFLKSGAVQPIDSIFDPASAKFVPLTKNYINKLLSSAQLQIGKGVKMPATVNKNPSVYDLVVPPRTGKFIYAGTSRFTEFLASTPTMVKKAFLEKLLQNQETAEGVNRMFNLSDIVRAINEAKVSGSSEAPASTVAQNSVEVLTGGEGLSHEEIQNVLTKGYALRGIQKSTRIAIAATSVNDKGMLQNIGTGAATGEYDVVFRNGDIQAAFIPRRAQSTPTFVALLDGRRTPATFALFPNGDYALTNTLVARGPQRDDLQVMRTAFEYSPPMLPRDVERGDIFAILTPDLELAGVFYADSISMSGSGVCIRGSSMITNRGVTVNALRNCTTFNGQNQDEIYIPFKAIVIKLNKNRSHDLEVNINSAQARLELSTLQTLGAQAHIGYHGDAGGFSYNGKAVGGPANILKVLIIKEGIDPTKAESFVKQAQDLKSLTLYLSKTAQFSGEDTSPSYGDSPSPTPTESRYGNWPGAEFNGNVQNAVQTNDSQTVEATLLTELLQAPDMLEYVNEYLPDISEAIDKLGRILFLSRLNMVKLFSGDNASEVFSFISGLRNVYRTLGDNYLKLERFASEFGNQGTEMNDNNEER